MRLSVWSGCVVGVGVGSGDVGSVPGIYQWGAVCVVWCVCGRFGGGGGIFGIRDTIVSSNRQANVFQPLVRVFGNWQVMSRL